MAISFQASLDQSLDGSSINVGSGINRALFVGVLARGNTVTGVTFNGVAMTQVNTITSSIITANEKYTLWVLANPASGSHVIQTSGGSGTIRIAALALNGVNQTTPYNTGATATQDSTTTAPHSCPVTTQYLNSWLVGYIPTAVVGVTADSNTTFPNANNYTMAYSPTAQSIGSHALGFTSNSKAAFLIAEVMLPITSYSADVTEAGAGTEAESVLLTTLAAIAESGTGTETSDAAKVLLAAITEVGIAAEVSDAVKVLTAAIVESGAAIETQSALLAMVVAIVEAATATETNDAIKVLLAAITESGTATDVSNAVNILTAAIVEAATATETQSALQVLVASITESANATEIQDAVEGILVTVIEQANAIDVSDATITTVPILPSGGGGGNILEFEISSIRKGEEKFNEEQLKRKRKLIAQDEEDIMIITSQLIIMFSEN